MAVLNNATHWTNRLRNTGGWANNLGSTPYGGGMAGYGNSGTLSRVGVGGARSGSQSTSRSESSVDFGAKSKLDDQFRQGISYANQLRGQTRQGSQDRISGLNRSYDAILANISQLGGADRARINRDATARSNSIGAQLAGTGLHNSTILPTLRQAVERDRLEAQGQLDESLRQQNISALLQKVQTVDAAKADQLSLDSDLGRTVSELYARMASNTPTRSTQSSANQSLAY